MGFLYTINKPQCFSGFKVNFSKVQVTLLSFYEVSDRGINFYDGGGYLTSDDTSGLSHPSGPVYWLLVTVGNKTQTVQILKN